jgi:CO/xanthine dehydrogenase Mo-binding subunit
MVEKIVLGQFMNIGKRMPRDEGKAIVTGAAQYIDDLSLPGMLVGKMLRSRVNRGRITRLDTSPALKVPGVMAVICIEDVPQNIVGGRYDTPIFPEGGDLRHFNQPIACVAAVNEEAALKGVAAIIVEVEELPALLDMDRALDADAPRVRPEGNAYEFTPGLPLRKIRLGDVEKGFAEADAVVETHYEMAPVEHAPIETQACLAFHDNIERLTLYTTTQQVYSHQNQLSVLLKLPMSKLRLVAMTNGGGFGGKSDMPVEPYAALLAMKTRRPVKITFTREEEMNCSTIRGKWQMHYKDGVTKDGFLTARYCKTFLDSGPRIGLGPYCLEKGSAIASGPYYCPNIWVDARLLLTNKAKASSLRGLGIFASMYASETQMSKLAAAIGMDPIEFRMKNVWREGAATNTSMKVNAVMGIECMQEAARLAGIVLPAQLQSLSSLDTWRRE